MAARSFSNDNVGTWTRKNLQRFSGRGPKYDFLNLIAFRDTVVMFDDFIDDTIDATKWAVANSSGTSAANFAVRADIAHGTVQGDTGTDDNGSISLIGDHLAWLGDNNAGMEIRLKTDIVTGFNLECGFIDAVPVSNAGGVNDEDTPSFNAADCALFSIDTDETRATAGFYTIGSTGGQGAKGTGLAGVPSFTSGTLPVADTFYVVRIQLEGNSAFCYVNDRLVASHNDDPQGNLEGGVKLAPWVYCRTRSTTAVFPEIDYIAVWSDRG